MIGSKQFSRKLSDLNDHDKKIARLSNQNVTAKRNKDDAEINFFKHMNAIDEEFESGPFDHQSSRLMNPMKNQNYKNADEFSTSKNSTHKTNK